MDSLLSRKKYNFSRTPLIKSRDQAWENNYGPKEKHSEKEPLDDHGVHMPDRSWCPLITAIGLFVLVLGMLFHQSIDASGEIARDHTPLPLVVALFSFLESFFGL